MSTELAEVTSAVAEFDRVATGIAELATRYKGVVYDVATTKGMVDAKEARRAIREPRIEVEKIRKSAKAPILALGKKLDSEAARITKELEALEDPIHLQITTEEARKEAERQARIEVELRRVADLQERVAELRGNRSLSAHSGSVLIGEHMKDLEAIPIDDSFDEFRQQAEDAKVAGLAWLRELHAGALAHEQEQERIKAEREELATLRAEQTKRDAEERARILEEQRQAKAAADAEAAKQAEALRVEREALAEERRAQQAQREAEEAQLRQERAQAEAAQREEAERLAAERRAFELQQAEAKRLQEQKEIEQQRHAQIERSTDAEIVEVVASHYRVSAQIALKRLRAMKLAQSEAA